MKNENKLGLIVLIFSLLILTLAISYAIWNNVYQGKKINSIATATLILTLDDESSSISLENSVPVSDDKGLSNEPYTFKIYNSGTVAANYRIRLVDDETTYLNDGCTNNRLSWSNIKYGFGKNSEAITTGLLSDKKGILLTGTLKSKETNSYNLRIWIKSSATNEIM